MRKKKKIQLIIITGFLLVLISCFILYRQSISNCYQPSKKEYLHQYVYFGKYPQSKVTNEELINKLNQLPLKWKSYGYYNGNGALNSAVKSDYMLYADVTFEGETYRGVRLTDYRSFCCHMPPNGMSWQQSLFALNNIYWYKYDPIRWIVLSESESLLLCEMVLDSQAFNNLIYAKKPELGFNAPEYYKDKDFSVFATDYYTSDIRIWLNDTFFKTAFSAEEAKYIVVSELDNSAWSRHYRKYDSKKTNDQVFILSYNEATNSAYGFCRQAECNDKLRTAYATDYAISQGVGTTQDNYSNGASWWWLRTGGKNSSMSLGVNFHGSIQITISSPYTPDCVDTGVRPAIRLSELPN